MGHIGLGAVRYRLMPDAYPLVREPPLRPPKLLDRVREALRLHHASRGTEKAYVAWIRRFIFFHGKRHPAGMGAPEITESLSSLAVDGRIAARRPKHRPIVLTRDEVRAVIFELQRPPRLMATLLYGSGLRLLECCRLRVQEDRRDAGTGFAARNPLRIRTAYVRKSASQ